MLRSLGAQTGAEASEPGRVPHCDLRLLSGVGIKVSFGATAKVTANTVTGNDYTPAKVTACGLLIYKAGGVSASKPGISFIKAENSITGNETDICNFGKGGGFSPTS